MIDATQWMKNGDHPEDDSRLVGDGIESFLTEGKVVRRFRRPDVGGGAPCAQCNRPFSDHGWIDTLEGGHNVCPGDFIITGVKGERYPCKPEIFALTYEAV